MSRPEIPLLCESAAFSARLIEASRRFGDPKYQFYRRVNWSHRYDDGFREREADLFRSDPGSYLAGNPRIEPRIDDVFVRRLPPRAVMIVVLKVLAHWFYQLLGRFSQHSVRATGAWVYRKCYVDDIELVFDPAESGVVRAVYPFPLNMGRQVRYLRYLRAMRYRFRFAGNPYKGRDLLRFLARRDVRSLRRLESRAQIRHARDVASMGFRSIQLSDEFDIGSLDFTRALARHPVSIVNSAHGVGKYLPVHAYAVFYVLTQKQVAYYHATRACSYRPRSLNVRQNGDDPALSAAASGAIAIVVLSQTSAITSEIVDHHEASVLGRLQSEFGGDGKTRLYFKLHPTSTQTRLPDGFERLTDLSTVNGRDGTIFVSLFSTCQIDPNFRGRKILVRGPLIHPEIAFDDSEEIVTLDELIRIVREEALPTVAGSSIGANAGATRCVHG